MIRKLRTARPNLGLSRGRCRVCGRELILRQTDGKVKAHGDCPGGRQPPAKRGDQQTVNLPE